jgi:PadR family transcriptional regulator PadR
MSSEFINTNNKEKIENAKAQMRKGVLEMCILGVISGQELYTSDIIHKLKEADLLVVEGTVYPLLTRLKNGGLLDYSWKESSAGPPRKYYTITPDGEQLLNELLTSWAELVNTVSQTTKTKNDHE